MEEQEEIIKEKKEIKQEDNLLKEEINNLKKNSEKTNERIDFLNKKLLEFLISKEKKDENKQPEKKERIKI